MSGADAPHRSRIIDRSRHQARPLQREPLIRMPALPPKPRSKAKSPVPAPRRRAPEQREQQIVAKAIEHFTKHGFAGSTRELARQIGVTQPLLYRYFPSKQALIDRVYTEVFSWGKAWETDLTDRRVPLRERMVRFYVEYAHVILREEWIRMYIFAGLSREGIYKHYLARVRRHVFLPLAAELRHEFGISGQRSPLQLETETELIWALHASIFYLGVRKWIYGLPIPDDVEPIVDAKVTAFLEGVPAVIRQLETQQRG
jgi:AcrR family transcriptional regulator